MDGLVPIVNALNRPFWEAAARGELVLPYCTASGRPFWPPSPLSPFKDGGGVDWRPCEATGVVAALAVYRRPFHPLLAPLIPYGVALVTLDAGPRLQAHVPAADSPDAPRAGQRVRLIFRPILPDGPSVPIAETA